VKFRAVFSIPAILFLLILCCAGCKTRQKPIENNPVKDTLVVAEAVENKGADSLVNAIRKANLNLSWFSARLNVKAELQGQVNNFNANLRMRPDSAIWISISPALGIEVARVLITRDSLKFLNRLSSTFFEGNYAYLNDLLQIEVNFDMIQSIFLGNAYLHYSVENYVSARDSEGFILSTLKKRRIRRDNELDVPQILTQEIWFSPVYQKVVRMELQDYRPSRKFSVNYLSFTQEENLLLPEKLSVQAQAEKQVKIDMEYSKLSVSKSLNLPFSIPKGYEPFRK